MPTECCVPGCVGKGGHQFPTDASMRAKWIVAIRRDIGRYFHITENVTVVCHQHFTPDDYNKVTAFGKIIAARTLVSETIFSVL
jgi:putative NADH-flavin reductase